MKNYCDLTFILDRSGSMSSIAEDVIGGFNSFIKDQKELPIESVVSLIQFDNQYEVVYSQLPIKNVPPLKLVPRGMTALLDAVGKTINSTGERLAAMPEAERPSKVVMIILTDGLENSSFQFNSEKIKSLVKEQTDKYNWQFVFLGSNQDAWATGGNMGFSSATTMTYANNTDGVTRAFCSVSSNYANYVGSGAQTMAFSQKDIDEQKAAGVY